MVYFCIRIHLLEETTRKDILHLPFSTDLQLKTEKLWSQLADTTNEVVPSHGVLPSQESSSFPPAVSHVTERGKGARISKPKRSGTKNGFSAASDEADEDDAVSLGSVSVGDDADRVQSALRMALYEAPEKMIANPAGQSETEDRLLDAVAQFCVFLCTEPYRDGKSASTVMVYFAGILGISPDGTTFERHSNYTPKLSALVHVATLCLLEATLPRFGYPSLGWDARPCLE